MPNHDGSERVLCVSRYTLNLWGPLPHRGFIRFNPGSDDPTRALAPYAVFLPRTDELECDCSQKQIITYGVIRRSGEFLCYERPAKGGDPRLRGRRAFGVGGHVNPDDLAVGRGGGLDLRETCRRALVRELVEEVGLSAPCGVWPVGLVNDEGDAVGTVHAGIVSLVAVAPGWEPTPSREVTPVCWVPAREAAALAGGGGLESWSEVIAPVLPSLADTESWLVDPAP